MDCIIFIFFCLPWQKNDVHLWIDWIEGTSLFFTRGWRRSRCGSNQDLSKLFSLKDCHRKIYTYMQRGDDQRWIDLWSWAKKYFHNLQYLNDRTFLSLAWLSRISPPTAKSSFVENRLDFGCDFSGNCGLTHFGWFWPFCGIWKFLLVRGRNSGSPLSRLPCHLNSWA